MEKDLDHKWLIPVGGEGTDGLLFINHNGIPQNQAVAGYSRSGWDGSWDVVFYSFLHQFGKTHYNVKGIDEEGLREQILNDVSAIIEKQKPEDFIFRETPERQRIELAKKALMNDGFFSESEIGDDIAPRIIERLSARDREIAMEIVKRIKYYKKQRHDHPMSDTAGTGIVEEFEQLASDLGVEEQVEVMMQD